MNKIQESIDANMDEIISSLPKEFQADAKAKLTAEAAAMSIPAPLTGTAEVAAIKAELAANPAVDETKAAAELTDIKAPSQS